MEEEPFEYLETAQIELLHQQAHERQSAGEGDCATLRTHHDSLAAELNRRGIAHDTMMICPEIETMAPNYRRGFTDDVCAYCAFGQLRPYCNLYKFDYLSDFVCDSFRYYEVMELEPPHGFLMANGKQTAIAAVKTIDTEKAYIIVSNGEAFGVAILDEPAQVKTKQFETEEWQDQHRVTPRERRQWWPEVETFYVYRLKAWHPYEGVKLFEDGQVIDEPKLTGRQWKLISTAKELPKQIILLEDAVAVTEKQEFVIDLSAKCKELERILSATYQADVKEAESAKEIISLYSLALVRNPRMRVSKKNLSPVAEKQEDDSMPYRIREIEGEYCVVKIEADDSDGDVEGCHATREEAEAQLTALNINVVAEEEDEAKQFDDSEWDGSAARWDTADAYCRDCLIDLNPEGEEKTKTLCKLPYRNPGASNPNKAALRAIAGGRGITAIEKPADVSDSAWNSQVRAAANRLIGWWPEAFDQPAPESIYSLAGKTRPKGETTFFERLKLAARNILDLITLAEKEEIAEEGTKLFVNDIGIGQKLVNGELWHFTYSTNAFRDREGEIFSTKALERYVAENEAKPDKGFFNLWHINAEDGNFNTDFARKEWQGVVGRFLVEAGPYLRDEKGQAARRFFKRFGAGHPDIAPEGWGCSPEFRYLPEERATGTYENIWITRTSTLPKMAAANIWTETRQMKHRSSNKMALSEQQKQAAIAMFGDEFVSQMLQEAELKTAELEQAGVAHKSEAQPPAPEPEPEPEAATKPPEVQLNIEELAAEVGKQFAADLSPLADAIATMAGGLKEMEKRLVKLEETRTIQEKTEMPRFVLNLKRASEAEETQVTEDDSLKNKKPAETTAGGGDSWSRLFNK